MTTTMSWAEIDVMSLKAEGIGIEEHYEEIDDEQIEYVIEGPEGEIYQEQDLQEQQVDEVASTPDKPRFKRITPEQQEMMLELQGKGKTVIQIATEMGLRRTTVHEVLKRTNQMVKSNILKLRRMQKKTKKQGRGKRKELLTDEQVDLVNNWLEEDSLLPMSSLVDRLKEVCGVTVSKSYIAKVIDDFTYSLSRLNVDLNAAIQQDNKLIAARQGYAKMLLDLHKDHTESQFVFVHFAEFTVVARTNANGDSTNWRGAKRSIYNAIGCALNKDKVLLYNFQFLAMETKDYCDFYTKLIERLIEDKEFNKAVLVLDEDLLMKGAKEEVHRLIRNAGYQHLALPRESVFLNPVERLFSGWKVVTRRANAKDEKALVKAMESADETLITQADCRHCYASAMSTMLHCYHGKWYARDTTILSFATVQA